MGGCMGRPLRKSRKRRSETVRRSSTPDCPCSCHRTPEKVIAACEPLVNYELHSQGLRQAQGRRSRSPGSRSLDRGRSPRSYDRPSSFMMDIVYVTERIIVITFPEAGSNAVYKNNLKEVTQMLRTKHGNKYKVFNLSERRQDLTKLNPQVLDFGWPPHLAPSLERLCGICKALDAWLMSDTQHIAVIHSKGDKGRTGVVIAAYMHYSSICASADQALDRFAMKRFYDDKLAGTMHPSQKRYIHYFSGLLSGAIKLNNSPLYLHHIIVHGVPNFDAKGGCKPFFKIYQGMHPVYTSGVYLVTERARRIIVTLEPSLQLRGDVLVKAYHKKIQPASRVVIFRIQFHTCTLESSRLSFVKEDMDDALYDSRFPDDGRVEFQFSYRPDDYKGNGSIHDAVVPVDNTLDSLVKWDSYENFDMMHDDAGDPISYNDDSVQVPHTEGPLDGSLYATVTKKRSPVPTSSPSQPSQTNHDNLSDVDGPHLSMDSGISSTSGLHGTAHSPLPSASSRQQPQHSNGSNGFPSPTTVEVEIHRVSESGHVPNDAVPFNKDEQAKLDELLDGMLKEIQSIPDILPSSSAQFRSRSTVPPPSATKATPVSTYHSVAMITPSTYHSVASPSPDYAVPRAPREVTHIYSSPPLSVVSVNGTKQSVTPSPVHIKSTSWTAETPTSPSPYQTPKNTCRSSTTFSQVLSSGSPKAVQRSMHKHNSLPSSLEYHRKAQEAISAEALRDVSSSPESKRPSDESSLTWLQRQQQKLRARKEGWEDRHHKEQKLIVELRSAQTRKASQGSDLEESLDMSPTSRESKILNFTMPLHVNTCPSYSPAHHSPPSSPYTTAKPPSSRGLSAPTSPIIPSRSSSKDITRSRFQQWHSHHRPLVRQRSDTSHDRERPFVSVRHAHTNTQEQSTTTDQMIGTPAAYNTIHPYNYRQMYSQSHSLPPQVGLTAIVSPALTPMPGKAMDQSFPAPHREQRHDTPVNLNCSSDTSGLLTLMDSRQSVKSQTCASPESGPLSPASSKLDELEQSLQALSSSSRSPAHSPQPPLYGQHSPVHYTHSTPAKAGIAVANGVSPWFPAVVSSSPSASPRSSDRPITPAFPVTSHTPYVNQDSPNIGAGLPPKSPPTSRKEHSPSPVAQPSLHQGQISQTSGAHIMNGQGSPVPHYVQSQRSSVLSLSEPTDVIHHHPVFVKDTSKFWYKPTITREEAINMLKDKPPGSFVVRDSNSFPGAFGIALKVATPPPTVQNKTGDISNELVRHFLIEPTAKGVRLKGCPNEPIFGSLSALVYQHSITQLALPCKLLLPESDPTEDITDSQSSISTSSNSVLNQGAACNVLYLLSVEMESLTGPQAIRKALSYLLDMKPPPTPTVVHFKVTAQGITLTDNKRKLFFRRYYQMNNISHCGLDPDHRQWTQYGENSDYPTGSSRFFGFVARKPASKTDNQCHIFAELEPGQPATAIVNFVNKIMMTIGQQKNRLNLI